MFLVNASWHFVFIASQWRNFLLSFWIFGLESFPYDIGPAWVEQWGDPLRFFFLLHLQLSMFHCRFILAAEKESCKMDSEMVVHNGGCHCRSVRWRVQSPSSVVAWQCNCSDCLMRGNTHFIVPSERFELLGDSKQFITTYTFGTHTAKHTFCKVCGITSFYTPRSNPDGVSVTFRCVDPGTLTHVEIKQFDGQNWEDSYNLTGISSCSKEEKWAPPNELSASFKFQVEYFCWDRNLALRVKADWSFWV